MKLLKSLRRRKPRAANPEKVFRGFVQALGKIRSAKPHRSTSARSKA
ncbi:MAG: hypothetical protein ACK4MV_01225 [Beijerinckiaceae bacterium]